MDNRIRTPDVNVGTIHLLKNYGCFSPPIEYPARQRPAPVIRELISSSTPPKTALSSVLYRHSLLTDFTYTAAAPLLSPIKCIKRKQRCEKQPIPIDQKDEKYFEKRKRNNEAAKKSRDARKLREDRIALKAALLERENAILKSQILSLQDEIYALAQVLCLKNANSNQ
ncbi:D site-binding protein [Uranotaenia lowii]|uniref:D site-binding protein n=1 Tax=Uranotaenia lowii TaxID=190385 RepID=UPI002479D04B|nr:D site-binding protein [Uranotaenia lowii]